ncbi:hypothetical protein BCV69DRAFT_46651 [Microstroma glucosiphilum]|uniref:Uncharacterized protein n=1 Tax=Pseudomicrostroma glucosiphilum TaxID=1684307 RepID=A0A316U2V4_9BASI|nr:hypothetical protein BCV69DRAFT_46651 [Pseudomicrostroma glucosiphilum]PWN19178.1 hypothetical protein BCV69DRAFT_46651 [Pseudomicrostroma glucosiphilum]
MSTPGLATGQGSGPSLQPPLHDPLASSNKVTGAGLPRKRGASATPDGIADKRNRPDDSRPGQGATDSGMGSPSNSRGDRLMNERLWGEEATKLDVYVWDYLTRRGFNGAAKTLVSEAQMNEPPDVPLKTPQGLLFEYWAIFWDVFAARSGRGTPDARAYLDFEEQRQTQRQSDSNRRGEAGEAAGVGVGSSTEIGRFPSMVMGNGSGTQTDGLAAPAALAVQQRAAMANTFNNGAAPGAAQPMGPAITIANLPQQQQQQILLQVARQRGIPIEEVRQYSPAMRQSLLNSAMQQSQQQNQQHLQGQPPQNAQTQQQSQQLQHGQPIIFAPGGPGSQPMRIAPGHPQYEQVFQSRLAQQKALQAQLGNRPPSRGPQVGGPPAALTAQGPNRVSMLPPGAIGSPAAALQPATPSAGPAQVGTPGAGGVQDAGRQQLAPQMQQQQQPVGGAFQGAGGPLQQPQQQQQQPSTPGGGTAPLGTARAELPPQAMLPEHLRNKPVLNAAQHSALISQLQQLHENIRQEGSKAQFAPNQMMAQQFFQNASSLQAKAQHLQEILKVQPLLQQAAASFAQQQAQARNAGSTPGGPGATANSGQMNPPSTTPLMQNGVLIPQQRTQLLSQQQQQQQGLSGRQDVPGMNGQLQVGQVGHQRPQTGDQQSQMGTQMSGGQQQQTPFQQGMAGGPHQGGGTGDYTSVEQPRSHAVQFTGNPFGRPGGMQGQPTGPQQFGMNRGLGNNEDQSHHAMQQYGTHGAAGLGRPALARSASNAMGAGPSTSSPSPRNPSVGNGLQGNNAKPPASANSPAAMIPSTPKQAAAEVKKKKEPNKANRKNSKAVKTPQLGHALVPSGNGGDASTPGGGGQGASAGGGSGGAPQTPSSNQPTPRVEHQQINKAQQPPPSRSGTGGGGNESGSGDINGSANHSMDSQQPSGLTSSASMTNFDAFAPSLDGLGVSGAGVGAGSTSNADASNQRGSTDAGLSNEDFSSLFASNEFFDFDAGGSSSGGGPNGGNGGTGNFDWDISSLSGMFGNEMAGGS